MIIINFMAFQIGWFSCVLGAAHGMPWLGPFVVIAVASWHLKHAVILRSELILLMAVSVLGFVFDQTLLSFELLSYPPSHWPSALLPLWMLGLWVLFATTLNLSLRWLRNHPLIAILFGAIGGPGAYFGAAKLGAIQIIEQQSLVICLAIGWAVLMPLLIKLSRLFDGYPKINSTLEVV